MTAIATSQATHRIYYLFRSIVALELFVAMTATPLDVFISYSHKDEAWRGKLDVHLANLKNQGKILAWHDRAIEAGAEWDVEIKRSLENAQVILLLITPQFMASTYCYDLEMERAVQRHEEGTARVIPIIIKPVDWQGSPFSKLQVLPKDGKPVTKWSDRDEAFLNVVQGIRRAVESIQAAQSSKMTEVATRSNFIIAVNLEELGGQVPLDSPFYIPRPPIEERCYEAIIKPGALIRIKAPRQMGKSSLMLRILDRATQQGYRSVWLNLQAAGEKALENPDSLLKWLCSRISRKLGLTDKVEEYWQGALGSNDKCTDYFELYLLEELKKPFALGLDEVDELFQHESVAGDFFGLLRSWHEESKSTSNSVWRNLRLIIAHSKEVYIPLNINQSPFNVGLPVDLPPLNDRQVADLIQRHGLSLSPRESVKLMDLTGGHPYLLRVALYSLARKEISFEQLLKIAPTAEWAYGGHLRRHLNSLEEHPELLAAMKQVIAVEAPVRIAQSEAFKLSSMGLVRFSGNEVIPLCDLYRQYFREMLK